MNTVQYILYFDHTTLTEGYIFAQNLESLFFKQLYKILDKVHPSPLGQILTPPLHEP